MTADAWMVVFGGNRQHSCVFNDVARAEQMAASLHGVLVPLVVPDEYRHLLPQAQPIK